MKKSILIIEDEKPNSDRLKRLIHELRPNYLIVSVLESVAESIEWLSDHDVPDLIMMDIRLADGLSFDIFNKVDISCAIIFTTAYDEYAVRAFKFNSIDYLLKPIEKEELQTAFEKLEEQALPQTNQAVEGLLNFINRSDYRNRFLLPYRDGYKIVQVGDVEYFFSEHKTSHAKLLSGKEAVLPQTMEELEQQLDPKVFFRANRQFILHIDAISFISNYFNGKLKVILNKSSEVEIIVSRDKAAQLKAWMDF